MLRALLVPFAVAIVVAQSSNRRTYPPRTALPRVIRGYNDRPRNIAAVAAMPCRGSGSVGLLELTSTPHQTRRIYIRLIAKARWQRQQLTTSLPSTPPYTHQVGIECRRFALHCSAGLSVLTASRTKQIYPISNIQCDI